MAPASILDPPGHPNSDLAARLVGQVLGGTYRILQLLDEGGMGAVFVAEQLRIRRRVAVKVLAAHLARDSRALARFVREAEVISRLAHPHVVSVLDFDQTDTGEPYLVMELLQGESLHARLARQGFLPSAEAVGIARQIAAALGAAHRASIVHRDLKPANVFLVNMEDEHAFVKLLDFGISKCSTLGTSVTGQFDVVGTPEYMSPEQASGHTATVDHRGDQYSLAVLTFEMLTGRVPFSGHTVSEVLSRVVSDPAPTLGEVAPQVPATLDPVLRRALSKRPDERYPSVADFATALALAVGQRPSWPYHPSRPSMTVPSVTEPLLARQLPVAPAASSEPPSGYRLTGTETTTIDAQLSPERRPAGEHRGAPPGAASATGKSFVLALADARRGLDAEVLERALQVIAAQFSRVSLSPQEGFLVSCIEPKTTVEDVLDLSPLGREETLKLLQGLARRGVVGPASD